MELRRKKREMKSLRGTLQTLGISNQNAIQQVVLGSAAGFATGYLTMMVGKKALFVAGGGIILFQVAQSQGLTEMTWDDARWKAKSMAEKLEVDSWKEKAKSYAKNNAGFSASFVGGFLIGAAYQSK
ncbi:hypothetical protein Trydic_g13799 [Trypoxylus dichotomus]